MILGSGAPVSEDQTIVIENGKVAPVGASHPARLPLARRLDLTGHIIVPGLVGMHEHLFYPATTDQSDYTNPRALFDNEGFEGASGGLQQEFRKNRLPALPLELSLVAQECFALCPE
jgi:hypothetical protein